MIRSRHVTIMNNWQIRIWFHVTILKNLACGWELCKTWELLKFNISERRRWWVERRWHGYRLSECVFSRMFRTQPRMEFEKFKSLNFQICSCIVVRWIFAVILSRKFLLTSVFITALTLPGGLPGPGGKRKLDTPSDCNYIQEQDFSTSFLGPNFQQDFL